ncbi:transcription factor of the MADS box, partial [Tulasnella sp. 332]
MEAIQNPFPPGIAEQYQVESSNSGAVLGAHTTQAANEGHQSSIESSSLAADVVASCPNPKPDGDDISARKDGQGDIGSASESPQQEVQIKFIHDNHARNITFSKRNADILREAYELSTLTRTEVLFLAVSEAGLVSSFTTARLQPLITQPEGKNLIQACLDAPTGSAETASGGVDNGPPEPQCIESEMERGDGDDEKNDDMPGNGGRRARPRKIPITFIQDEHRRNTTFNSRKAEIIKMAYELSVLTGTELLFLAASETGLVSSFATAKLQPLVTEPKGKDLIK